MVGRASAPATHGGWDCRPTLLGPGR